MKAMLSQPMAGKTDEEIVATREKAIKVLEGKGYDVVNTLFTDEWYQKNRPETPIDLSNVFIVWSCKTLHHFKCLASTSISGDGVYAEYTYNSIKEELYGDVYGKITNTCYTEE